MKMMRTVIGMVAATAILVPTAARAQQRFYDVSAAITQDQLTQMADDLGPLLRFRQMGDTTPVARGHVNVGVQFGNAPADDWRGPRLVARFGVSERVDIGAWGGVNSGNRYGILGADAKVRILAQNDRYPVSVSVRPSLTALIAPSGVWAGTTGVDLTVSRTFGRFAPYAGVAATSTIVTERLESVRLEHGTAGAALSYAGLAYQWHALVLSAELERGQKTIYAFQIGTRF